MAVYTEVTDQALSELLLQFGAGRLVSFKGIAEGVENTNYFVQTDEASFILTLYEKRVARGDLPFFLGLLEHLSARGISCPQPVRDRNGAVLTEVSGRAAALFTFLEGVSVATPNPHHCRAVGTALATLHEAAHDYPARRENALGPDGWASLFAHFADDADRIAVGLQGLIATELDALSADWPGSKLPCGIIHADLFPDNVFFLGPDLSGLIDFYFACYDALAYDLAICLNAWCFEADLSFNLDRARALFDGYQAVRPLSRDERTALPTLARGAALRFLITRSYDWLNTQQDALVKPHDPKAYLARLKFHQHVRSAASYGLDEVRA